MKKIIAVVIIMFACILYYLYLYRIDTKYAINYAQVLGSYDIEQMDKYLNENTIIIYNGDSKTYEELRENVIIAFKEKKFSMGKGCSYGHGDNQFSNGVQEVYIYSYGIFNDKSMKNVGVTMELKMEGLFNFQVKSLSGNDDFFGYLFFGIDKYAE